MLGHILARDEDFADDLHFSICFDGFVFDVKAFGMGEINQIGWFAGPNAAVPTSLVELIVVSRPVALVCFSAWADRSPAIWWTKNF